MMTPWVTRLLLANVAVFLLQQLRPGLTGALAFVPAFILDRPWTILTYMFAHGGVSHILFNMLGLFFFGPRLELELGGRGFVFLYVVSGFFGALLSLVSPFSPIIGASGAVYGVMMGFAMLWPREQLLVWGIVPVQARTMVLVMTALSLYGGFGGGGDGIAHFAHLGGFLGGFLFVRWSRARQIRSTLPPRPPSAGISDVRRWRGIPRERLHEVNRAELDRVMQKIDAAGADSLTTAEREFLDRFSRE